MAINPNIALALKTPESFDPLAAYGKIAAIQQAQNQNALAQYQLSTARREDEATNALNAAYREAYDPATGKIDVNRLRQSVAGAGYGTKLPGIEKTLGELERQRADLAHTQATTDKARGEILDAALKRSRQFLDTINPTDPNAPAQYLAWHEANHKDPVIGPALAARGVTAEQARTSIQQAIERGPAAFAELLNQSKLGADRFIELNKPQLVTTNLGPTSETTAIEPVTGKVSKVLTQQMGVSPEARERLGLERERVGLEGQRVRQEGERIGLEGRRVRVLEQQAELAKDPAHQTRMAQARATGELTAKNDVAAVQNLPKIVGNAQDALNLIDQMVGKPPVKDASGRVIEKGTAPHPGFQNAVGTTWLPGIRFVPGTDAANFMALFNQTEGSAFLEAFEALKGGGAITETEGKKATEARTRMSTAQSEAEFVKAAREYQGILRRGIESAQKRATTAASRVGSSSGGVVPSVSDW